jgi:hypothetical protein
MALVIRKNGIVILEAKDDTEYIPSYETEKDKPVTMYVKEYDDDERGLLDD